MNNIETLEQLEKELSNNRLMAIQTNLNLIEKQISEIAREINNIKLMFREIKK
jgi:hypothetical protein